MENTNPIDFTFLISPISRGILAAGLQALCDGLGVTEKRKRQLVVGIF